MPVAATRLPLPSRLEDDLPMQLALSLSLSLVRLPFSLFLFLSPSMHTNIYTNIYITRVCALAQARIYSPHDFFASVESG